MRNGPRAHCWAALAAFSLVCGAGTAHAADEAATTITGTKAGDFLLGQKMAQCSAHYEFMADRARDLAKPAAERQLRDLGRGWLVASEFALTTGSTMKPRNVGQLAKDVRATQATKLAALFEMSGDSGMLEITAMREKDCDPLTTQQEAIVSALRQTR